MGLTSKHIVIIGAGFGGIYAYLGIHRHLHGHGGFEVTIINETDVFTFIPLIHEVATGNLQPGSVTQSIRTLPTCCLDTFIEGRAERVDLEKRVVYVREDNAHMHEVPYDILVLGLGSETRFYDIPGASQYSVPLKDLADARRLRNTIIERFENARDTSDLEEVRRILRFVVVGGGPTGVEIVGELADLLEKELAHAFPDIHALAQIVLVVRGEKILSDVEPWFGKKAERILDRKPFVTILCDASVTKVEEHRVLTTAGHIATDTVIWAAGVQPRSIPLEGKRPIERDEKSNRIKVTRELSLEAYPEVYVVGDGAWIPNENGEPYPMRAQFAKEEGMAAAENIVRSMRGQHARPFHYRERGFLISLGKGGALGKLFGIKFSGPLAWFIYRHAYFMAIVGWRAKIRTGIEWFLNLFLPRDISKI